MKWLTRGFRREKFDRDLDNELQFHVDTHARELIEEGVSPDEARRRALAAFGGTAPIKELTRDARGGRWLEDFFSDLRYAGRTLKRQPGFATVAILTLTLGIGANTAIFSMVNAVLLRPLPVREPEQLVLFTDEIAKGERTSNPFPSGQWSLFPRQAYDFIRAQPSPFASVAAFASGDFLAGLESPAPQQGRQAAIVKFVSGNFFDTLGAPAAMGRTIAPDDNLEGAPPAIVASDRFWRERLGTDPNVIGRTVKIGGTAYTVIGVMPPAFFGVRVERAPDIWAPLAHSPGHDQPDNYWLTLIGRLKPGATVDAAQAVTTTHLHRFLTAQAASPIDHSTAERIRAVRVVLTSGARGISPMRAQNGRLLVLLLCSVGVVLLIACANVGTLFLARAAAREREVAVRRALGAGRGRLIRQWLTESALLAGLGALFGAGIGYFAAPRLLATFIPATVPVTATIDGVVLAFTTAIALLSCVLFGLAPALNVSRVDPISSLRLAGRAHGRLRAFGITEPLVVAQIAMSLVLVAGATLLVRTLVNLQQAPTGLDQDRVLLTKINPRPAGYRHTNVAALYRQIHDRLAALPGVEHVSFARGFRNSIGNVRVEGYQPAQGESVPLEMFLIGPNYSQTMGMPLLRGRAIAVEDTLTTPLVAVVNETLVRRYFAGANPIGRHVIVGSGQGSSYEIVGVVRDAQFRNARDVVMPGLFISVLQENTARALDIEFNVRAAGDANAMIGMVRTEIAGVDPKITIERTRTLRDDVMATLGPERTAVGFIGAFSVVALLVASIGLYGVVAHGLRRRTNEIGVRIALGAGRGDIVRLIARETATRLGAGVVIGFGLTVWAAGFLRAQLFGVTPADPLSFLLAAAILSLVVALTTVRPLWRAMRTDPVVALRAE